jgi:hypothetical protein
MKDKLFYNTYHQNRQKKRWYKVSPVVGEHDRHRQLQSKTNRISIKTLMIVSLQSVIKVGRNSRKEIERLPKFIFSLIIIYEQINTKVHVKSNQLPPILA